MVLWYNIFVALLKRGSVNNIKNILTQAYFEFYAPLTVVCGYVSLIQSDNPF